MRQGYFFFLHFSLYDPIHLNFRDRKYDICSVNLMPICDNTTMRQYCNLVHLIFPSESYFGTWILFLKYTHYMIILYLLRLIYKCTQWTHQSLFGEQKRRRYIRFMDFHLTWHNLTILEVWIFCTSRKFFILFVCTLWLDLGTTEMSHWVHTNHHWTNSQRLYIIVECPTCLDHVYGFWVSKCNFQKCIIYQGKFIL